MKTLRTQPARRIICALIGGGAEILVRWQMNWSDLSLWIGLAVFVFVMGLTLRWWENGHRWGERVPQTQEKWLE